MHQKPKKLGLLRTDPTFTSPLLLRERLEPAIPEAEKQFFSHTNYGASVMHNGSDRTVIGVDCHDRRFAVNDDQPKRHRRSDPHDPTFVDDKADELWCSGALPIGLRKEVSNSDTTLEMLLVRKDLGVHAGRSLGLSHPPERARRLESLHSLVRELTSFEDFDIACCSLRQEICKVGGESACGELV
jgi:hypothetical protein